MSSEPCTSAATVLHDIFHQAVMVASVRPEAGGKTRSDKNSANPLKDILIRSFYNRIVLRQTREAIACGDRINTASLTNLTRVIRVETVDLMISHELPHGHCGIVGLFTLSWIEAF